MAIFKIGGWVGLMLSEAPEDSQRSLSQERATRAKPRTQSDRRRYRDMQTASPRPQRVRTAGAA
jgi:hypothetical protein